MGVIKRQGIKTGLVHYVAVAVAAVATLLIYPLDPAAKGAVDAILGFAMFFMPFAVLGANSLVVRFFPLFKDKEKKHNGFLFFLVAYEILALSLFSIVYLSCFETAILWLDSIFPNIEFLQKYKFHVLALTWLVSITSLLSAYISNFQRTTVPAIFTNLMPKLVMPVLILLVAYGHITIGLVVNIFLASYVVMALGLLSYLAILGEFRLQPNLGIIKHPSAREIPSYALFGILGSIGSLLAFRIDIIMVTLLINEENTGVYTISSFIANSIQVPTQSLLAITAPIIATHIANNEMGKVGELYKKTSLNLVIIGTLLFTCIWAGIDDVLRLTPRYELLLPGVYVVLWAGLAKVWDMATSINSHIIGYSKYFRFNFYVVSILGVLNVSLNYVLIPKYGIAGAALATFLSLSIFNVIKLVFIWRKFRIQPFSKNTLYVLLLAVGAYFVAANVFDTGEPLLNIALKSSIVLVIMGLPIWYFNLSPDLNETLEQGIEKIRNLTGRKGKR